MEDFREAAAPPHVRATAGINCAAGADCRYHGINLRHMAFACFTESIQSP